MWPLAAIDRMVALRLGLLAIAISAGGFDAWFIMQDRSHEPEPSIMISLPGVDQTITEPAERGFSIPTPIVLDNGGSAWLIGGRKVRSLAEYVAADGRPVEGEVFAFDLGNVTSFGRALEGLNLLASQQICEGRPLGGPDPRWITWKIEWTADGDGRRTKCEIGKQPVQIVSRGYPPVP